HSLMYAFTSCFLFFCIVTLFIYTLSLHDALPIFLYLQIKSVSSALFISSSSTLIKYVPFGSDSSCSTCSTSRSNFCSTYSFPSRSEEHTSELQSRFDLVCRLLLEKKNRKSSYNI